MLFVIAGGTDTSEVYDYTCKKFVALKQPTSVGKVFFQKPPPVFAVGYNIIFFGVFKSNVLCYDITNNEWCVKSCGVTEDFEGFSYVQVPQLQLQINKNTSKTSNNYIQAVLYAIFILVYYGLNTEHFKYTFYDLKITY